jgi:hypothetical protein
MRNGAAAADNAGERHKAQGDRNGLNRQRRQSRCGTVGALKAPPKRPNRNYISGLSDIFCVVDFRFVVDRMDYRAKNPPRSGNQPQSLGLANRPQTISRSRK